MEALGEQLGNEAQARNRALRKPAEHASMTAACRRAEDQVLTKYGGSASVRESADLNAMIAKRLNKEGVHAINGSRLKMHEIEPTISYKF